jgi:hypothetical protein
MFRRAFRVLALVLPVAAALVSACGTPTEPTDTMPPSPTEGLVPVTETFSGTLAPAGSNLHTFRTMPGLVRVTLVSVDPAAGAPPISMGIGMWDGLTCQLVLETPVGTPGSDLLGTASIESQVCIKVWDVDRLAAGTTLSYQLTAVHNEKPSS